jgi:hypothetical protein
MNHYSGTRCVVPDRSASLLEPLAKFVLEVLPWTLSSLIVLYLIWGLVLAPQLAPVDSKRQAERGATALVSAAPATRLM